MAGWYRSVALQSCLLLVAALLNCLSPNSFAEEPNSTGKNPLAPWQAGVKVRPVLGDAAAHSVHSYFNTSPESPDGNWILFFRSEAADAVVGEICILHRASGAVKVLVKDIVVEDVHRVACQQWALGGKQVVFHALREGHQHLPATIEGQEGRLLVRKQFWKVGSVNIASGKESVLAIDHQVCWGVPTGEVVPIYGPHWNPGKHRNLELVNVHSGEIASALSIEQVRRDNAQWFAETFGEKPTSIFFPILSPDGTRVLFKIATPAGGGFRNPKGSQRDGLFCYDLKSGKMLCHQPSWGHPAWHPDSRQVINVRRRQLILMDSTTGDIRELAGSPLVPGSHPSFSPDGKLYVSDLRIESPDVPEGTWAVIVGDVDTGKHVELHRFDGSRGATSWRVSHPHPVFSPDGSRVYFNVNADRFTRLFVAEADE